MRAAAGRKIPAPHRAWRLYLEVDEFLGENAGLVVAEIELPSEDSVFDKPDWIGQEVTGDKRYYNSNLIRSPYSTWTDIAS